jgi:alpha-tubulin suppressor-like RCC1 family protein
VPTLLLPAGGGLRYTLLAGGESHMLVVDSGGAVTSWGLNDWGQAEGMSFPAQRRHVVMTLPAGKKAVSIGAGYHHSLALMCDD